MSDPSLVAIFAHLDNCASPPCVAVNEHKHAVCDGIDGCDLDVPLRQYYDAALAWAEKRSAH